MPVPIRPEVAALPAYQAGRTPGPGPDGRSFKLSSNENPYPALPGVLAAVQDACRRMALYPDMGNVDVTAAVARFLTDTGPVPVGVENLAFGTGSVAALYHVLQTVCTPGDEVVYAWRSFEAYPIAVQVSGARAVPVPLTAEGGHDLAAMRAAVTERTRVVMVCTPNNPTGPTVDHDELAAFIDSLPSDVLVLVDEAYVEYVTDPAAARGLELWQGREHVAVLRTFSKAYALAGFRVGYLVAEPPLTQAVRAVALPFGVSVPAQAAVVAALREREQLTEQVRATLAERDRVEAGLRELGFRLPQCQGNFVWLPAAERTTEYAAAYAARGVTVRPYVSGEPGDGVRISIGLPEANDLVLEIAATLPR